MDGRMVEKFKMMEAAMLVLQGFIKGTDVRSCAIDVSNFQKDGSIAMAALLKLSL